MLCVLLVNAVQILYYYVLACIRKLWNLKTWKWAKICILTWREFTEPVTYFINGMYVYLNIHLVLCIHVKTFQGHRKQFCSSQANQLQSCVHREFRVMSNDQCKLLCRGSGACPPGIFWKQLDYLRLNLRAFQGHSHVCHISYMTNLILYS